MVKGSKSGIRRRRRLRQKCRRSFDFCDKWTILHTNIRGYDSKAVSLHAILNQVKPSVVTINETYLKNNRKLTIPGFTTYNRNRQCVNGGGIATCVQSKDAMHTLKVFEGEKDNEMLITRHSQFVCPINVINIYGEVESRSTKDNVQEKWASVLKEVTKIESKGDPLVILTDM